MSIDLRYSVRRLLKSPEYTLIALLTLALGIGVTVSAVNIVDAFLFRSAPFPDGERIVAIQAGTREAPYEAMSYLETKEIEGQTHAFQSIASFQFNSLAISENGSAVHQAVSVDADASLFAVLRLQPALGRAFTPEEAGLARPTVILLTHSYWVKRFRADPSVVGTAIRVDGAPTTIIGVMPPEFDYKMLWGPSDVLRPIYYVDGQLGNRDWRSQRMLARLKENASAQDAEVELAPLQERLRREFPAAYKNRVYLVRVLHEALMDEPGKKMIWMIFVLSLFVLAIACANLANLQLARATANLRGLAIQSSLGASRLTLIRQQLAECVVLSVVGGAAGLVLAFWINDILQANIMIGDAPGADLRMSGTTLAACLFISLATGITFGFVPAWIASGSDMNSVLKSQGRGSTSGKGQRLVRNALIVGEVVLAIVLLAGASVLIGGFNDILKRPSGWANTQICAAELTLPETRYPTLNDRSVFVKKLLQRLKEQPGVADATVSNALPVFGFRGNASLVPEGHDAGDVNHALSAFDVIVWPNFFSTLGLEWIEGGTFSEALKENDPQVVVINQSLARRMWPGQSALGKRIGAVYSGQVLFREVVGVVKDVSYVANASRPSTYYQMFRPYSQEPWSWFQVAIRSSRPESQLSILPKVVAELDPDLPALNTSTISQRVEQGLHNILLVGKMMAAFAILGVVLAAVGLYGVISNLVAQRTNEFGIRLALGALPGDVFRLVLRHGLTLSSLGVAIGIVGAFFVSAFLRSIFDQLGGVSVAMLVSISLILALVSLLSSWLPARKATRVDPLIALRAE